MNKIKEPIINGKWIVRYNPLEFNDGTILETLVDLAAGLAKEYPARNYTEIIFSKNIKENTRCLHNAILSLRLKDKNPTNIREIVYVLTGKPDDRQNPPELIEQLKQAGQRVFSRTGPPLQKSKIKNILLYFPFLLSDTRWKSISLTASAIFLGSGLSRRGFKVKVKKLQLPAVKIEEGIYNYNLIGFTLFEELLPEFKTFLEKLRDAISISAEANTAAQVLLVAGGPLVTLNPLQVAYHLPDIHLLVRGEAELIFPGIVAALQKNDLKELFNYEGFIFRKSGLLIISGIDKINRPTDFNDFYFDLSFLEQDHLKNGLEINFSRGCRGGCLFCSKVQGKIFRKLPLAKVEELLAKFSATLKNSGLPAAELAFARSLNINDDDILQDRFYAAGVLKLVKQYDFKIWGIQASPASFFGKNREMRGAVFDLFKDREVFMHNRPLVWLGTDSFLKERGSRLGKRILPFSIIEKMVREFEQRDILNYHYWICSDYRSTWQEFVGEFFLIHQLLQKFEKFALIAHSPFLVPYCSTPLYDLLTGRHTFQNNNRVPSDPAVNTIPFTDKKSISRSPRGISFGSGIKYKTVLKSAGGKFDFPLVNRLETGFPHLNKLLNNDRLNDNPGFFDSLKQKDYINAAITLYNFLKQERLFFESLKEFNQAEQLSAVEKEVEQYISKLI